MRVNIVECAARAVGAFTTVIGDQLSATTADTIINETKHSTIRRIIMKKPPLIYEPSFASGYRKRETPVKGKRGRRDKKGGEVDATRMEVGAATDAQFREMPRHGKTFCCGAGGGRMWFDESPARLRTSRCK